MPLINLPGFTPKREIFELGDGTYRIDVTPPVQMRLPTQSIILTEDQFRRWELWINARGLIQDLLPDLTAAQREILMTGIGDEDFKKMFAEDDDEEEGDI